MTIAKESKTFFSSFLSSGGCLPFILAGGPSYLYIEGVTIGQDLVSWQCILLIVVQALQNPVG